MDALFLFIYHSVSVEVSADIRVCYPAEVSAEVLRNVSAAAEVSAEVLRNVSAAAEVSAEVLRNVSAAAEVSAEVSAEVLRNVSAAGVERNGDRDDDCFHRNDRISHKERFRKKGRIQEWIDRNMLYS